MMGVGLGASMAGQSIFRSQILSPFGIRSTRESAKGYRGMWQYLARSASLVSRRQRTYASTASVFNGRPLAEPDKSEHNRTLQMERAGYDAGGRAILNSVVANTKVGPSEPASLRAEVEEYDSPGLVSRPVAGVATIMSGSVIGAELRCSTAGASSAAQPKTRKGS